MAFNITTFIILGHSVITALVSPKGVILWNYYSQHYVAMKSPS